ncbi:AAA family ATPase [Chlorobium sp. N1]|uniref:ATP-binding protein n=1 Tax=Chlorobium sp. N1 TaxID=2491138 RepID=UPI00103A2845|nr:AAA family ATPase [Chlorobium sp. N1]TCD47984.1 AAA family ATPase [Chlorobium sp. N1]
MENLFREQRRLTASAGETRRSLYGKIDWNERCIGILGARGTGKTTLMLQQVRAAYGDSERALYLSVDSPYFQARNLFEFAREFRQLGGETLLLDEIHKYPDWSTHVKAIYDTFPELKVVFSGSSLLQISREKGDLSRRAMIFRLHGLSLREYIHFTTGKEFPPYPLETILQEHVAVAESVSREIVIRKAFREYLESGYYPFFLEGRESYPFKLREVVNHIIDVDLPSVVGIETRQLSKLKKLLYLLATSVPFTPNISKLAEATGISRPSMYEYLERLQDAGLLNLIRSRGRGYEVMTKPDKILLENANLLHAISESPNTGTQRELFFVNQLKNAFNDHQGIVSSLVELSGKGDYIVRSTYTFEVGGANKGFDQLRGVENSYVAADDLEVGFRNNIPLWLFGFLY